MKNLSEKVKNRILLTVITALAICLCCGFTACTKAQAESSVTPTVSILDLAESVVGFEDAADSTEAAAENYSRWLSSHYSTKAFTCEQWLKDLMDTLGLVKDDANVLSAAYAHGIIDSPDAESYSALTRRYAATTLVKALGYPIHSVDGVSDLGANDAELSTLVYYGFFIPDSSGMVYPNALINAEEYSSLLEEVDRYSLCHGKTMLSFGDSIMYGLGNNNNGIADMVAEKYGMNVFDYSISGATFGVSKDHSHIADQIKTASSTSVKPDVILINGGTNDMAFTKRGKISDSVDVKSLDENTFAGGFEYSAYLLQKYWKDVPVIYVRAHDMGRRDDAIEQDFGVLALNIAQKWDLYTVDIYNDTDFCTENEAQRDAYTLYKPKLGYSDGVHPTALGYAKYYLPLVTEKLIEIL